MFEEKLLKKRKQNKFLIATHRGVHGANIAENTRLSSKLAFRCKSDMVELDVIKSKDGVLFAFHSGEEKIKFKKEFKITELTSKEIDNLEYLNCYEEKTGKKVERLEDILKFHKGDYLINLDRAWDYFDEVFELVSKLDMEEQIIVKSAPKEEILKFLEKSKIKLMYMPIISQEKELIVLDNKEINVVAVELIFKNKDSKLISDETIRKIKKKGILIWVNTIRLSVNERHNLCAWQDDDFSLENNNEGWQYLFDKGVDIMQTDWPIFLDEFRKSL